MKWHKAHPFTASYTLTTEVELLEYAKKKKIALPPFPEDSCGFTIKMGGKIAIVLNKHKTPWERIDTLIHESVHIFQAIMEYSPENIQLVCSALNSFRKDTQLDEFIWFCEQVTNYQKRKEE